MRVTEHKVFRLKIKCNKITTPTTHGNLRFSILRIIIALTFAKTIKQSFWFSTTGVHFEFCTSIK